MSRSPSAVDLIRTKRDGGSLDPADIGWFVERYSAGELPDEQAAALLMAIVWRGMTAEETAALTQAMVDSGERLDWSDLPRPTVTKHSTGGIGDKVSLVLVPLVAACGAAVPKLSGRGLGHTGGTLDKLDAIPGFRSDLSPAAFARVVADVGCAIGAAGPSLAPADAKLYHLRDVTATVDSVPLIASSIMSKKLAEGASALVLEVTVGSGAFIPDLVGARHLARTMVGLGEAAGVRTHAVLTAMDTPLGCAVGNAVEVAEAVEVLEGGGPDEVRTVVLAFAAEMLALAGIDADPAAALDDGSAAGVWRAMVAAQGGDPDAELPRAAHRHAIEAPRDGWVWRLDARAVGRTAWLLGAGRERKTDPVSPTAGVRCLVKPGQPVTAGQPVVELLSDDPGRFERAAALLDHPADPFDGSPGLIIGDHQLPDEPLIIESITDSGG